MSVSISSADAKGLSAFSDGLRTTVLAPTGWQCHMSIGANGTSGFDAAPTVANEFSKGAISGPHVAVVTDWLPHPLGVDLMCPYFEVAKTMAKADTAAMACPGLAAGETITQRTDTIVRFESTAANGNHVMGAARVPPDAGTSAGQNYNVDLITCELPVADQKLCSTIIDSYLAITQPKVG